MSYAIALRPTPLKRFLSPETYVWDVPGTSVELVGLSDQALRVGEQYFDPVAVTGQREALNAEFQVLVEEWQDATQFESSLSDITAHPAYQAIIALGQPVVPVLLRELETRPSHLFTALRTITGVDPVSPNERGRIDKMAKAWLRWGKEQGLSW